MMSVLLTQSVIAATILIPQAPAGPGALIATPQSIGASLNVIAPGGQDTVSLAQVARASRIAIRDTPATTLRLQSARKSKRWLPWAGAAVGGTVLGIAVADERDLVFTGKLMWIGVGAAIGAGAGWVIGKIADP
jgi:hypothetical protein